MHRAAGSCALADALAGYSKSRRRWTVQGHEEIIWAVEVRGNMLFTASADKTVRVWDINSKRCVQVCGRVAQSAAVRGSSSCCKEARGYKKHA